jgi:hypothetical protein
VEVPDDFNDDLGNLPISNLEERRPKQSQKIETNLFDSLFKISFETSTCDCKENKTAKDG